ncbi:LysR family transcriptional regulator [Terrihabitans rhizophilus]|uniref:LysR family transcriptional regulator n=1 Tax=Terrihabitans rhizophilus TaxID=3092662 RepID=A0ABU4RVY1_9HYPH|nr:LysR family transcriptional regulator [Terrihabitans sp. PJ23]MDX6807031.1 LysR family transcriptional regulator [Terrihabitans sp. PJ23]
MIDKLEFVLALAREGHFGRAAEACGVTQPTLSAGLKQLEDELGVRLVDRGSRFQGFTAEGERVLDWARRIVGDNRAMRQEIESLKKGLSGRIRIAAIPTALPMLAALTTPFRQRHPDVTFNIISRASVSILTQLENLDVDVGITYLDNEPLGRVKSVPLYREEFQLFTSLDSPVGRKDKVTWKEAGKLPLCLMSPDMQNRRIIDGVLRSVGSDAQPTLESDSLTALVAHVRTGQWSAVMPRKFADMFDLPSNVRAIPLVDPEVFHTIGLIVPERDPLPPLTAALFSEARQLAPTLTSGARRG